MKSRRIKYEILIAYGQSNMTATDIELICSQYPGCYIKLFTNINLHFLIADGRFTAVFSNYH